METMTEPALDLMDIRSETGEVVMRSSPQHGGTATSLQFQGQELLYTRPSFGKTHKLDLDGGFPFLFPVCGRLERGGKLGRYSYHHSYYDLPIHGFAPYLAWDVINRDAHQLELQLTHSEKTLPHYPFHFTVCLDYQLTGRELICKQTVINCDTKPMPYSCGFHPYFRVEDKARTLIKYDVVKCIAYNERLTDVIGEKPCFNLPTPLNNPALNEQLTMIGPNKKVQLQFPDGLVLILEAQGLEEANMFPYIQLYHRADEPFFCVEPWMSVPNALNTVSGMRWLLPGQTEHAVIRLSIQKS